MNGKDRNRYLHNLDQATKCKPSDRNPVFHKGYDKEDGKTESHIWFKKKKKNHTHVHDV